MSAVIKNELTPGELSRVRSELYAEKVKDWDFICQSLVNASPYRAQLIKNALATSDAFVLEAQMKIVLRDFIESELLEEAVEDFLGAKHE